ncbi:hypothetical protein D3C71_2201150 [compost metagenome]
MHLGVWRNVDIDHGFQLGDVEPARRHVRGHQDRAAAVRKLHQHLIAVTLFQIAMQRQCLEALRA